MASLTLGPIRESLLIKSSPCFAPQGQKQGKTELFKVAGLREMQEINQEGSDYLCHTGKAAAVQV